MVKKRGMRSRLRRFSRKRPTTRSLAKRVSRISRTLRKAVEWYDFADAKEPVSAVAPYQQFHVNNYINWLPTFLMSSSFNASNQFAITSLDWMSSRIQLQFKLDNDYDNVTYTTFLVQLKDQFRNDQFNDNTGVLTLTAGVHYNMTEGMVTLNKRFFVVRGIRKFILGNFGINPATVGDAGGSIDDFKRLTFKLRPYKKILRQTAAANIVGTNSLPDPDPSKNYYVLVFSSDTVPATSQKITYRADHVCKSY